MEEIGSRGGLLSAVVRQNSARLSGGFKPISSGRSASRNSPSFRRLNSSRTPRRELKAVASRFQWIRNNVVFWLMLIALWAYIGFHVQSKWAHNDHNKEEFVGYTSKVGSVEGHDDAKMATESLITNTTNSSSKGSVVNEGNKDLVSNKIGISLKRKGRRVSSRQNGPKKNSIRPERKLRRLPVKAKGSTAETVTVEMDEGIPRRNTSYGLIVGPFGKTEDTVLGWSSDKRKGTCDRKGEFARIVWSRSFLLVFHELSMTGAPLSMMEVATELLSCGGTVSAVVLSKKGGLMGELDRRGINVLTDKAELSYKKAMKVDLVIAGSAVCSTWIEQYLLRFPTGPNHIVWWIMENRREYFNRSKHILNRVKTLSFLSESQSKQWLTWCTEENIKLISEPILVPLAVNDELAFVAGIPCSLNTPASSVEKMLEKRNMLRSTVRKEMGLSDNDMLVMSLSSINAGKGQKFLLESAFLVAEHNISLKDPKSYGIVEEKELLRLAQNRTILVGELNTTASLQTTKQGNVTSVASKKKNKKRSRSTGILSWGNRTKIAKRGGRGKQRKLLSEKEGRQDQTLKLLIGSIGSKSNKVLYIKALLRFLSQHANMSKSVLWTPSTTRVASLYAAADVYVINSQGLGETFGRVTIEAMAFDLPILGTDAGGTREIVEHGVTGLLHPLGHEGVTSLAENLQYLLSYPSERKKMGMRGRLKVQNFYLKQHMYKKLAEVLVKSMKIK